MVRINIRDICKTFTDNQQLDDLDISTLSSLSAAHREITTNVERMSYGLTQHRYNELNGAFVDLKIRLQALVSDPEMLSSKNDDVHGVMADAMRTVSMLQEKLSVCVRHPVVHDCNHNSGLDEANGKMIIPPQNFDSHQLSVKQPERIIKRRGPRRPYRLSEGERRRSERQQTKGSVSVHRCPGCQVSPQHAQRRCTRTPSPREPGRSKQVISLFYLSHRMAIY